MRVAASKKPLPARLGSPEKESLDRFPENRGYRVDFALGLKTNRRYGRPGVETSLDAARKECVRHKAWAVVVALWQCA
jgi:hypothetical protein